MSRVGSGLLTIVAALLASACGGGSRGQAIPLPGMDPPPEDGLLTSPELQALVELQTRRDAEGLLDRIGDPSSAVRARAALALGSVQDPGAFSRLRDLLSDPDARVRANAAFALGRIPLPDGGRSLVDAVERETDPWVRAQIYRAAGIRAEQPAILRVAQLAQDPVVEVERVHAVAQGGLRNMRAESIISLLGERVTHEDPAVRMAAAQYFGRASQVGPWISQADRIRAVLDGLESDDPIAMHLTAALARLGNREADLDRLMRWLGGATDWRTRVNGANAVQNLPWLGDSRVTEALFAALDDPSEHVAIAAAASLSPTLQENEEALARAAPYLNRGGAGAQTMIARVVVPLGYDELAIRWVRRVAEERPWAAAEVLPSFSVVPSPIVRDLLFDLAEHQDEVVRAAAIGTLGQWAAQGDEPNFRRGFEVLSGALSDPSPLVRARAAAGLAHDRFAALGAPALLEAAYGSGRVVDPTRIGSPVPEHGVDWAALAELGTAPRVRIETERGEMVARLVPEQAPTTVGAFVELVRSGAYDGDTFHRVVPNFVIQAGDVGIGDGTGGPGYRLPTELTQVPFARGVLGMASSGKDTEGSQFFLTHSDQPHLDGIYTAFGWLESGAETLDAIQAGDRIVRITVLP